MASSGLVKLIDLKIRKVVLPLSCKDLFSAITAGFVYSGL
jgi:hypothetical protein